MTKRLGAFGAPWLILLCALGGFPLARGQSPVSAAIRETSLKELAAALRTMLLQAMPETLYEGSSNWGQTSTVPDQIKWRRKGLRVRAEVYRHPRNDGTWRKVKLSTRNPAQSLSLEIRDWKYPDADHMTFTTALALDSAVDFEQQIWKSGVRLYSGSLRARMRVYLTLACEVLLKLEKGKNLLPDLVFRLRVTKSEMKYDNLVVEHIAGIGGTGAKVLGEALQSHIKQWRPSLERDLIAKANAAVVRAADTREVRLGLGSLWKLR
jgi:hypothetical protein